MYWAVPTSGKRLKVGVPVKDGFTEFVKLQQFQNTAEYNITGVVILILEHRANDPGKLEKSYTANLSSNMAISWLQHSTDKLYCIGFQDGSFVKEILIKRLDFNISRIKSYASVEQYHDALSKGCQNGGVDAILDELPSIKIFLDKYGRTNPILPSVSSFHVRKLLMFPN
ncbi:hypothetical protein DCAR_0415697 [Daucus carota subsp. sativus]|uniref:Ionotropic glutamate receptor C-terminal domain-containing protein n=1 Tax=Daucus carota subsp. sativus TaxID=79200 RepID=A0A165WN41_DAUCS|nr:hypothetical protein DCAR_0415697 [Daucus carota subsp. sativus]